MSEHIPKGIPENAKRMFKGVIFDVWQWEQEMFDGTTQTFERLSRQDTACILPILSDGRILLVRQEQPGRPPYVGLAAGRIEEGEEPEGCAARELMEETGYAVRAIAPWFSVSPYNKIAWSVHFFIGRGAEKAAAPIFDTGEKTEPFLVTFDEFIEATRQPEFRDNEVALHLYRLGEDKQKLDDLKRLFFGL